MREILLLIICLLGFMIAELNQRNFRFFSILALVAVLTCTWKAIWQYVTAGTGKVSQKSSQNMDIPHEPWVRLDLCARMAD